MPRRRRRKSIRPWRRIVLALLAIPLLYLAAAAAGAMIPLNRGWVEPDDGITVYLANNGVHADLILPAKALGLDWTPLVPRSDFEAAPASAAFVAFGAGERKIYLETPRWRDLTPGTALHALTGGQRVMHVEWVEDPSFAARAIRLTPEQYRRLWASIRAGFRLGPDGQPIRIDHAGYGPTDAFYQGIGKTSAIDTCNQWIASRLRLAGVRVSAWTPFVQGLVWRYREAPPYRT